MEYLYWENVPTRWADNDCYGHMNNVVHYAMMDTAVNSWMIRRAGFDPQNDPAIGLCVASSCRYTAESKFPDVIRVGLRIGKLGTSSVRWEIGLFKEETEIAHGDFTHVFVDRVTRRPVAIGGRLRDEMEKLVVA